MMYSKGSDFQSKGQSRKDLGVPNLGNLLQESYQMDKAFSRKSK